MVAGPAGLPGAAVAVFPTGHTGSTGDARLDAAVVAQAQGLLAAGRSGELRLGPHGECDRADVRVFVDAWVPPPRLLVFGAVDYAAALTRIGAFLGYRVTVCDAREVFATPERFPEADEVVVLRTPADFHAVGQWYEDFEQLTDDDVLRLLEEGSAGDDGPDEFA